jgi:branched-chain amino acid transport system permease protein
MISRLLSNDLPRSRWLSVLLILLFLGLAFAPFLFPGVKALNVAAKVLIFVALVASFDLLLGYTGIVSFAHTMFFGIGAYGVAISLRVKAIFFAMITLAVASAFLTLASQLSDFTGGEDGLTFRVPELLSPGFSLREEPITTPLGEVDLNGRLITYYLIFLAVTAIFLTILRIVNSPFGRVLQAIRENDFRAEALGYRTVVYRTLSNVLSASFATLAGCLLAIWLRYNGPDTSLSFEIMLDILLIVVIGGMGTLYGALIGSVLFLVAQSYLQDLLRLAGEATQGIPLLPALLTPDRWLLWLGLLFVLSVYYFPTGIVGKLRERAVLARMKGRNP